MKEKRVKQYSFVTQTVYGDSGQSAPPPTPPPQVFYFPSRSSQHSGMFHNKLTTRSPTCQLPQCADRRTGSRMTDGVCGPSRQNRAVDSLRRNTRPFASPSPSERARTPTETRQPLHSGGHVRAPKRGGGRLSSRPPVLDSLHIAILGWEGASTELIRGSRRPRPP